MPKEFYTEKDIEDLVRRGITSLETNDNVVLTQLAYEKANRLGMRLVRDKPDNPPGAPVRPYIAQKQSKPASSSIAAPVDPGPPAVHKDNVDLQQRIRSAVVARLGTQVDASLLAVIIKRVLTSTGVR